MSSSPIILTTNRIDRLLTDARAARNAIAASKNAHEDNAIVRALIHLEGHIDNLKNVRAMVSA